MSAPEPLPSDDPRLTWVEVARTPERRKSSEWALVLESVAIGYALSRQPEGWIVITRGVDALAAREQLERYERENKGWPPRELATKALSDGLIGAMIYAAVIVFGFLAEHRDLFGLGWWQHGRARADAIVHGAWWQAITALTLHADVTHLAGNLVFGAVFGVLLAQSVGSGLAWILFLATGALGNLVNAIVQPGTHSSIGASTAVFGALGALSAYEWMRRKERRGSWRRRWIPLVAGAVLLGMLGMGDATHDVNDMLNEKHQIESVLDKTDVVAHLTGFASGLLLGAALGMWKRLPRLSSVREGLVGTAAMALVVFAWWLAFRA